MENTGVILATLGAILLLGLLGDLLLLGAIGAAYIALRRGCIPALGAEPSHVQH